MKCEACEGQGWLIFTVDGSRYVPDGSLCVQRCDACDALTNDSTAITIARMEGLDCSDEGIVTPQETDRWMKLYPNRGIKPII